VLKKRFSGFMYLYILLYSAAAFLLFHNLSGRLMWGDEAATALLAQNIMQYGVPLNNVGKNVIAEEPSGKSRANEKGVWTWDTWLAYYLTAVSFRLLGATTFAARLPFVLVAFLAVLLVRPTVLSLYKNERIALIATLLLVSCVPFLLHSRQCRYYSIMVFTTLWILYGYNKLVFEKESKGGLHFALASITQFYGHLICFFGNLVPLGVHSLIVVARDRKRFRQLLPSYAGIAAAILPWVLYSEMLEKGGGIRPSQFLDTLSYYVYGVTFHVVPLIIFAIPLVYFAARRAPLKEWIPAEKTVVLAGIIVGHLLFLSVFPMIFFRYLLGALTVLLLLEAYIIGTYVPRRPLRYALVAVLVGTNLLHAVSLYPVRDFRRIRSPLLEFVGEITSDYEDKFENVLAFLEQHASEDESIATMDIEYALMFYTNMEVVDARYPENQVRVAEADWVMSESPSGVMRYDPRLTFKMPDSALPYYEVYEIEVRDTPLGASRPDPDFHYGFTAEKTKKMKIYHRIVPLRTLLQLKSE
jgi:hypothetical protein